MYIEVYTDNWKNINRITFYFVEKGPGPASEDIKKEYNVNCFYFFLLFCLFDGRHVWKNHSQLKKSALKLKNKKHTHIGKELEAH